jgi:nucleotide-binding universal stress UspA family protein
LPYTRILVGTDGSPTADKAVETAAVLARRLGAELHILTAYRSAVAGGAAAIGPLGILPDLTDASLLEACQEIVATATASYAQDLVTQAHVVSGSVADAIVDTAEAVGADLVVVGSKGMHGARRLLGSVPNSVAHHAGCDVLIVKTD